MNRVIPIAAALLGFLPMMANAQAPAPTSEAAITELLAALPPSTSGAPAADAELARLNALNPGKASEIEAMLTAYRSCVGTAVDAATVETMRSVAIGMGEQKVRRLAQFYRSPDFPIFSALADRQEAGQTLSAAEARRLGRFVADYPIVEFGQKLQAANAAMVSDRALITKFTKCSLDKKAAFIRAGIIYN